MRRSQWSQPKSNAKTQGRKDEDKSKGKRQKAKGKNENDFCAYFFTFDFCLLPFAF